MADLNDRSQLLLAGAFVLAAALIALTVALTASNYTETLATESDEVTQGGHAITVRESVEHHVETLLVRANRGETGYGPRETMLRDVIPIIAHNVTRYHADDGRRVNTTLTDSPFTDGVRIKQTSTGDFEDPVNPGVGRWRLAGLTTVRNATFVFERPDPATAGELTTDPDDGFKFILGDWSSNSDPDADTHIWEMVLFRDGTDWKLRVTGPAGSETCTRSRPASAGDEMTVNVDSATIDGKYCDALAQFEPTSTNDVWFEEGAAIEGRYWLTVKGDRSSIGELHSLSSPDRADEVLYSAMLDYRYFSSTVDYETEITVLPGELS